MVKVSPVKDNGTVQSLAHAKLCREANMKKIVRTSRGLETILYMV